MKTPTKLKASKEKFEAYVAVQKSGLTNMWAVDYVCELAYKMTGTPLDHVDCMDIIKNYDEYAKTYA